MCVEGCGADLSRTHAKTTAIGACGGSDGGGGQSTCSGAGEGDVGEADEAMVACAVVGLICLLVGGIVRCVCVHGRTCVDGGCARRQSVSDWSCVWRGVVLESHA